MDTDLQPSSDISRAESSPVHLAAPDANVPPTPAQREPEPDGLQAYALQHICVQPPYFALRELARDGEWVTAEAPVEARLVGETGPLPLSEGARHLAILGSLAARLADPRQGRIFFPVRKASIDVAATALGLPAQLSFALRARCTRLDRAARCAYVEAEALSPEGTLVTVALEYHVLPENTFRRLFSAYARDAVRAAGVNPYASWRHNPPTSVSDTEVRVTLPPVSPADCVGHFDGLPAYPVSLLTRDVIATAVQSLRARGRPHAQVFIRHGAIDTQRFVFAGEVAELTVRRQRASATGELWRCEVTCAGQPVAQMDMEFEIVDAQAS